jgi:hypothetical protein
VETMAIADAVSEPHPVPLALWQLASQFF